VTTEVTSVKGGLVTLSNQISTVKAEIHTVTDEVVKISKSSGSGGGSGSGSGSREGSGSGGSGSSSSPHSSVIDSSFPIPTYNSSLSPDHFLQEVEEFLTLKRIGRNSWTALLSRMLPSDSDLIQWWRALCSTGVSWDDFKRVFKSYESSISNSDSLKQKRFLKNRLEEQKCIRVICMGNPCTVFKSESGCFTVTNCTENFELLFS
jgi:hypothetical protein